jgi:uncharacterized protein (TIGR03086 family)
MDIRELHRRSLQALVELANTVTPDDLDLPTPCSEWDIRNLLEHQVAQNHGFAFAASGQRSDLAMWEPRPLDDPVRRHAESAVAVLEAFAAKDLLDRGFWVPEIRDGGPFPASMALGFHFVDCVVHGWDLATALGVPSTVDDDLAEAALPLAADVPDTPDVRGPGKAFHDSVAVSQDAPVLKRVVALLGRTPD